jgi:hypothetical protein
MSILMGFSHRFPRHYDLVGIMDHPVADGVCKGWVTDNVVPHVDRDLTRDDVDRTW